MTKTQLKPATDSFLVPKLPKLIKSDLFIWPNQLSTLDRFKLKVVAIYNYSFFTMYANKNTTETGLRYPQTSKQAAPTDHLRLV